MSDALPPSPIAATIDLAAPGASHGFLRLPHSRDDSAWGSVMIPLTVVKNGSGPTALFAGANHGDEYEGPLALQELALELDPARIQGRVIIVPFMNYPAFRAGLRTSPIDRGNLNRTFPGRPDGTVTETLFERNPTRLARTCCTPAGTRTMSNVPSSRVIAPNDVPSTVTLTLVRPWLVAESTTRPRIDPTACALSGTA